MATEKIAKTTLKREQQRIALIDAAERAIAQKGLNGFKARELADEIGVGLGQIYNLVADLDELLLRVSSKTLLRLESAIEAEFTEEQPQTPEDMLIVTARAYHHFARDNYNLWRTLFDHQLPQDKPIPDWVSSERLRPFQVVDKPLGELMKSADGEEIKLFSQTLFSSIHGLVSISLDSRDVGVPPALLDKQIGKFIKIICRGLKKKSK